jgi:hypothetical protein
MDIDFNDTVRTFVDYEVFKGANESGSFTYHQSFNVGNLTAEYTAGIAGHLEAGVRWYVATGADRFTPDMVGSTLRFGNVEAVITQYSLPNAVYIAFTVGVLTPDVEYPNTWQIIDFTGWQPLNRTGVGTGRYIKPKLEFNFINGFGGYIRTFNAVADKTTVFERFHDVVVPIGGRTVDFLPPYHRAPAMSFAVKGSGARTVSFPTVTPNDFSVLVFNAASDSGGTIDVSSEGA